MADDRGPIIKFKTPTFRAEDEVIAAEPRSSRGLDNTGPSVSPQEASKLKQRNTKRFGLSEPSPERLAAGQDVYLGSYAHGTQRGSLDATSRRSSPAPSPRASTSHIQLEHLLPPSDADLDTYGVEELRDGFFDAAFFRPRRRRHSDLMRKASLTLPAGFQKHHPLSFRWFVPQQLHEVKKFFIQISTSRAGIKLLKSFLGFFVAYVICLIPASRDWLGRYNYIIVISAIINHPGRAIGSQIDGAVLTILGTVAGLGWGSLALFASTSTPVARDGYGGVLATFLVLFTAIIAWLRCVFLRFYQFVLCAGIAICYTCLADTSQTVGWIKVFDYGIPWVLGQAVCLAVSILVFPEAGSRQISQSLHESLMIVRQGISLETVYAQPERDRTSLKRDLALQFVDISQAVRDFTIECTISRFEPGDVVSIRNLIQAVIRSILSITPDETLFNVAEKYDKDYAAAEDIRDVGTHDMMAIICTSLAVPARELIAAMRAGITRADIAIMCIGGQVSSRVLAHEPDSLSIEIDRLRAAKETFDAADAILINHPELPSTYGKRPEVIRIFLFVHPLRQTADKVEAFLAKVSDMRRKDAGWRIRKPSYPWYKALMRTNAQVRHDRGGLTAGFYFRSKHQLEKSMADLQSTVYVPAIRNQLPGHIGEHDDSAIGTYEKEKRVSMENTGKGSKSARFRYQLWTTVHRLQGFEMRFAFKVTLVTTLISVPAWLPESRRWWSENEIWWAVVVVWAMMHPRVGGTFQDLNVRCLCAVLGAVWGGLAYAANNGNPYVIAVFATIYMVPMLHRFTQSSHPRSGIVGCISFAVVSLDAYTSHGKPSIVEIAWTRGLAFVVGIVAALIVNWLLWPFIARHELRKSLSSMMLHSAILYRGVVAKYIYFNKGDEPGPEQIAKSEMLEGRLREAFVRMRQLMEMTRHEMRLRAPFNPLPYSALIATCESFFEHLVQVRQSSLYFQPSMLASDPASIAALTTARRDAVAVILLNLYVLACALRSDRPVPKYLPGAAAARQKLLDRMEVVEAEAAARERGQRLAKGESEEGEGRKRRWRDVYQYAYSGALTDIVEQTQELQRYTKEICGEVGWVGGGDVGLEGFRES